MENFPSPRRRLFKKAAVLTHADLRHGDAMPKAQVGGREERRRRRQGRRCWMRR